MEQEGPPVVLLNDDEIAGATQFAGTVARPDFAGHVLRERAGQNLGLDDRSEVVALLPDQRAASYAEDGRSKYVLDAGQSRRM